MSYARRFPLSPRQQTVNKLFFVLGLFFLLGMLVGALFFFVSFPPRLVGKASFELSPVYNEGEPLSGYLNI